MEIEDSRVPLRIYFLRVIRQSTFSVGIQNCHGSFHTSKLTILSKAMMPFELIF
jgi:hypothetical protein